MDYLELTAMVIATGAVGTAAFGIVEALKWTRLGLVGFARIGVTLREELMQAIAKAYGAGSETYLQGLYRQDRAAGGLPRALRQGVRVGLTAENAARLAEAVGVVVPTELQSAAQKIEQGAELGDRERSVIGRFELAVDTRIEAAIALADASYKGGMQIAASLIAIGLAFLGAATIEGGIAANWPRALLVGVAAVPIAPIAKDVAAGIKSARQAMGRPS
jgi:hypothetical protein